MLTLGLRELIIVLRELTIGLRTLILSEGGRRELTLDLRELIPVLTLTQCGCHIEKFKSLVQTLTPYDSI